MLKHISKMTLALVLMVMAVTANAANFYIRPDGGNATQCTGKANVAYPGSGTGLACAWDHPYRALPPSKAARIQGGDTVFVARGKYAMGYGAPDTDACNTAARRDCYAGAIPAGPDAAHPTRILGEGWDKGCMRAPELWGQERANSVLYLSHSDHVRVQCFEITDHSECGYDYSLLIGRCNKTTTPHGPYAISGILMQDSNDVVLKDLNIHGMAHSGIFMGRMSNLLVENVRAAANWQSGINGDLNSPLGSSNSGSLVFRKLLIEWNGCRERYPSKRPFGCIGQSAGGYGDGVGFATTDGDFLFEDSVFRYNTSDGLDVLYHTDVGSVIIRRSWSEANVGNSYKFAGPGRIESSVAISNCAWHQGKPEGTYLVEGGTDICRAMGNPIALHPSTNGNGTIEIINNTILSDGDVAIDTGGKVTDTLILRNNIIVGFNAYLRQSGEPGRHSAGLYYVGALNVIQDHNIWWQVYNYGATAPNICPGTGTLCVDPKFVNSDMNNPDLRLRPDSPAINAGISTGAPTLDYYRVPRTARGGVDIGAIEAR